MRGQPTRRWSLHSWLSSILLVLCCFISLETLRPVFIIAQVTSPPITSSGLSTHIGIPLAVDGKIQFDITGGTRPGGGPNLFHSFGNFDVPNNNIANFLNDSGLATSNILGRVTGGNISNISGTIQTIGFSNANLFLMNPAGFLFGPNATVNVGGMVAFTSADYLKFTDNARFNVIPNTAADALLTASPITAFGFLGSNPGAITVQGSQLSVADGTGISLVGGNITIQSGTPEGGTTQPARLSAPDGKIQVASTASPGEFEAATLQPLSSMDGVSFTSSRSVSLAPGSNIDVSGGSTVSIRGGQFILSVNDAVLTTTGRPGTQDTITVSSSSSIVTSNTGVEAGDDVQIRTGTFQMDGALIKSTTTGSGSGGNISLDAETVVLTSGAQIVSDTEGAGAGGNVIIDATGSALFSESNPTGNVSGVFTDLPTITSGVYTTTSTDGSGGSITVTSPAVTLQDSAQLATITAIGNGHGGDVSLDVGILSLRNGGRITTLSGASFSDFTVIGGTGQAGDIAVTASDSIFIGGVGAFQNSSAIRSIPFGSGSGGSITVAAPSASVTLDDRGLIETNTFSSEQAGDIALNVNNLTITNGGGIQTSGNDLASSGNIQITAHDTISLVEQFDTDTPSRILNQNDGLGGTGDISIQSTNLALTGGARILSDTKFGFEGADVPKIVISTSDSITLSNSSRIDIRNFFTDVGALNISGRNLTLTDGAMISTLTFDFGTGGPINIDLDKNLTLSGGSQITSTSLAGAGSGGDMNIHAKGIISLSGQATDQFGQITPTGILSSTSADFPDPSFTGNAGHIVLTTSALEVLTGARVDNSSKFFALGNAGEITVTAPTVTVNGGTISTSTQYRGNAGTIALNANTVTLSNGGQLTSSSVIRAPFFEGDDVPFPAGAAGNITLRGPQDESSRANSILIDGGGSGIFTDTKGIGPGGNITLNANTVTLQNDGTISAKTAGTETTATGGSITVNTTDHVTITDGASITASSTGLGNAGDIVINAGQIFTATNSNDAVTTQADAASGGNITLIATDTIQLTNSRINASVADGSGGGGNISIDPQHVILQGSQILAQAADGQGGAITITTNLFLPDPTSRVNADANPGSGVNGTVTIQSPNSPASGRIQPLGNNPLEATSLLNQRCAALDGGQFSSFTVAGRDILPTEPDSWLASPLASLNAGTGRVGKAEGVKAEGWRSATLDDGLEGMALGISPANERTLLSLRQIAPAGFLTQAFAADWSAACQS